MDGKIVLLMIAVVAVGMFALPSTLAMYTGQHEFVNGTNVNCSKCHSTANGIGGELAAGDAHSTMDCGDCHGSDATVNTPDLNGTAHAASIGITCIGCHSSGDASIVTKDGIGINVSAELELTTSAHSNMSATGGMGFSTESDAPCVACHTMVGVNVPIGVLSGSAGNMTVNNSNVDGSWMD